MRLAEQWRLERDESLDLFLTWRSMGGEPPTLGELLELPSWMIRDFQKLSARLHRARQRKKQRDEYKKETTSASSHSRPAKPQRSR